MSYHFYVSLLFWCIRFGCKELNRKFDLCRVNIMHPITVCGKLQPYNSFIACFSIPAIHLFAICCRACAQFVYDFFGIIHIYTFFTMRPRARIIEVANDKRRVPVACRFYEELLLQSQSIQQYSPALLLVITVIAAVVVVFLQFSSFWYYSYRHHRTSNRANVHQHVNTINCPCSMFTKVCISFSLFLLSLAKRLYNYSNEGSIANSRQNYSTKKQ